MPTPTPQQQAAIQQQLAAVQNKLKTVGTAINAVTPTMGQFLADTKQTQKVDATAPTYTDAYNTQFNKYQNIRFGVASQEPASAAGERALYLFDPAVEAKKRAEAQIASANLKHSEYQAQQAAFQQYVNTKNNEVSAQTFNMYFNDVLKQNYNNLSQGYIDSSSPLFNKNKFMSASGNNRLYYNSWQTDAYGRRVPNVVMAYKDPTAVTMQLNSLRPLYQDTFNKDKDIQNKYRNMYKNSLQQEQASLQKQLRNFK